MNFLFAQWDKLSVNYKAGLAGFGVGVLLTAILLWLLCR